jgi:hypothetical protein
MNKNKKFVTNNERWESNLSKRNRECESDVSM